MGAGVACEDLSIAPSSTMMARSLFEEEVDFILTSTAFSAAFNTFGLGSRKLAGMRRHAAATVGVDPYFVVIFAPKFNGEMLAETVGIRYRKRPLPNPPEFLT